MTNLPTFDELYFNEVNNSGAQNIDFGFDAIQSNSYNAPPATYHTYSDYDSASEFILSLMQTDFWTTSAAWNLVVGLPFLFIIVYSMVRIYLIRQKEKHIFATEPRSFAVSLLLGNTEEVTQKQSTFMQMLGKIEKEVLSDDEQKRKMAIIELDVLLDEILTKLGYEKGSISEKLKQIPKNVLPEIDLAWEAHKVRNKIAHEGKDYALTTDEAMKAYSKYRKVFLSVLQNEKE